MRRKNKKYIFAFLFLLTAIVKGIFVEVLLKRLNTRGSFFKTPAIWLSFNLTRMRGCESEIINQGWMLSWSETRRKTNSQIRNYPLFLLLLKMHLWCVERRLTRICVPDRRLQRNFSVCCYCGYRISEYVKNCQHLAGNWRAVYLLLLLVLFHMFFELWCSVLQCPYEVSQYSSL